MATPTFTALATYTATGNITQLTFSSIPSGYKTLVLYGDGSFNNQFYKVEINGDTTATNYDYVKLDAAGTNFIGGSGNDNTVGYMTYDVGTSYLRFQNYSSSTQYKHMLSAYDAQGQFLGYLASVWKNTNAITSIKLTGTTFRSGAKFSLFGVE